MSELERRIAAHTVLSPGDVDDKLRHLISALRYWNIIADTLDSLNKARL